MKTVVETDICIGCELCASMCPGIYEMKENVAVVKVQVVPENETDCAKNAAKDCPVEAIKIE